MGKVGRAGMAACLAFWVLAVPVAAQRGGAPDPRRGGAAPAGEDLVDLQVKKEEIAYARARTPEEKKQTRGRLGEALRASADPVKRARGVRILLEDRPGDQELRRELAELAAETGRSAVAVRLFKQVLAARPADVAARIGLAEVFETQNRFQDASLEYDAALAREPRNLEALIGAAEVQMSLDRPEAALRFAKRALEVSPGEPRAKKVAEDAAGEIAAGKVDRASGAATPALRVAELRRQLEASPGHPGLEGSLALELLAAERPGEARELLLKLLAREPPSQVRVLALARAHRELGDYSGARLYAERAREMAPRDMEVHLELSRIWSFLGNLGEARRHAGKAREVEPARIEPWLESGTLELGAGQVKAAIPFLERARAIDALDSSVLASLARARWLSGDPAGAKALVADARREDPADPTAWRLLAEIQEASGSWRDAAYSWQEFLFVEPYDVEGWRRLGKARSELGELPGAARALEMAFALDGEDQAVLEDFDAVLARLPWTAELEDTRLLVEERLARLAMDAAEHHRAVSLLQAVAEGRGRQMRRITSDLEAIGEGSEGEGGKRAALLRRLLGVTRAKVRAHRWLAGVHAETERSDLVKREYLELHRLDPGSAEWVRELARMAFDAGANHEAVRWWKEVPPGTRMPLDESLDLAQALDATGREEQSERLYRKLASDGRDDQVEEGLSDHAVRKGNLFAGERHARRSYTLSSSNQPSLEILRAIGKGATPDWWLEAYRFDDSDGIDIFLASYGRRWTLSPRTWTAATLGQFRVGDRFTPTQSDIGAQVLFAHELSERARLSSILGLTRFALAGDIAFDLRLDYRPDDRGGVFLRSFRDSINETPLASTRGFEQTGFELGGEWFPHPRYRLDGTWQASNITGGNGKEEWRLDLGARPLGRVIPGWFHFALGGLDYDAQVAPALYFSPADLARTDAYYQVATNPGKGLLVQFAFGLLRDIGFGLTQYQELELQIDRGQDGNVVAEYKRTNRSRSYHDFARSYDSHELTLAYNAQF